MISVLAARFFVTALLYASAGQGGGSAYSALDQQREHGVQRKAA
ncbi:MAG: hypothetical protein ACK4IC_00510 [Erythrobacter sp.]